MIDEGLLIAAGAQYGVPPSILIGVAKAMELPGGSGIAQGFGSLQGQPPEVVAKMIAAQVADAHNKSGDWETALAVLQGASPTAINDPNSPVSSINAAIMAVAQSTAASNPLGGDLWASIFGREQQSQEQATSSASLSGTLPARSSGGSSAHLGDSLAFAAQNNGKNYSAGQCTYYVASALGWIPGGLGNAADWAQNATQRGYGVSHQAQVGSVVVYGAGNGYSQYGHVAVVTGVNGDGTFSVSEMNVLGNNVADTRVSSSGDVVGFIQPPLGTDARTQMPGLYAQLNTDAYSGEFAKGVLRQAGLPITGDNVSVLKTMAQGEGTSAQFNPLATTQPGGTSFNSSGVQNYASMQQGIAATAKTLLNGHYAGLITAMRNGTPLAQMAADPGVQQSLRTWQGGSDEDVQLLRQAHPDLIGDPNPKQPQHDPKEVDQFAVMAKTYGLAPGDFDKFEQWAKLHNRFGLNPQDLQDFSKAKDLSADQMMGYVHNKPHNVYPEIPVGEYAKTFDTALLWSLRIAGRAPNPPEVARFWKSGAKTPEIRDYFQMEAPKDQQQDQSYGANQNPDTKIKSS